MTEKDYRRYAPFFLLTDGTVAETLTAGDVFAVEDITSFLGLEITDNSQIDIDRSTGSEVNTNPNSGKEYLVIPNWKNPRWFVPNDKNVIKHVGNLIKPTSLKAVVVWKIARLFNYFNRIDHVFRHKVFIKTNQLGKIFLTTIQTTSVMSFIPGQKEFTRNSRFKKWIKGTKLLFPLPNPAKAHLRHPDSKMKHSC